MAENTQEKRAGVKATRWPLTAKIQPLFGSPSQKINTHPRKVDCNQISGNVCVLVLEVTPPATMQ